MNENNNWIIVKKKIKKNKNPKKIVRRNYHQITKADRTLTNKEIELIEEEKNKNSKLFISCNCCDAMIISDIICRTFASCGKCYCCSGDNTMFDDEEWVDNNVTEYQYFETYNKNYHYTKDNEFS